MNRISDKYDKMDMQEMAELQLERLKKQLAYVYENSAYYRRKFKEIGLLPGDIKTMEDFQAIPFTTKDDLRQYNDEFICVQNKDVIDIGASTGTTGAPVILPATRRDWDNLIETIIRYLQRFDINENDVFQISVAFDQLFSVGTPVDEALKKMGVTTVRMGPGNVRRQLEVMKRLGTTAIYAIPTFMLLLGEEAKKLGMDTRKDFKLRMGVFAGEGLYTPDWQPNTLNRSIREIWPIEVYSGYGSMEMLAGFVECGQHGGHHTFPDHFLVEIIDPETGKPVPSGKTGELVFTHLMREGLPLVRFKQGDITSIETGPCSCGSTTPRMMALHGRVDHMMKIKGTSLYPEQIEEALRELASVTAYTIEVYTDTHGVNKIKVKAAIEGQKDVVFAEIKKAVKARARIVPDEIEFITREDAVKIWFSNGTRKPKKFWDMRKKRADFFV